MNSQLNSTDKNEIEAPQRRRISNSQNPFIKVNKENNSKNTNLSRESIRQSNFGKHKSLAHISFHITMHFSLFYFTDYSKQQWHFSQAHSNLFIPHLIIFYHPSPSKQSATTGSIHSSLHSNISTEIIKNYDIAALRRHINTLGNEISQLQIRKVPL